MTTQDFIAYAVLHVPCKLIDELCEEWNLDFSDTDIADMLNSLAGNCFHKHQFSKFGNWLVEKLYNMIIDQYSDTLNADDFEYFLDGADSELHYKGECIYKKEQLEEICERAII